VINGLPAHILLVHVVLAIVAVTAALGVIAAVSRPARRWLHWLPVYRTGEAGSRAVRSGTFNN
jgi:hypothetical protein